MVDEDEILADFVYGERSFEGGLYGNPDFYDMFYSRDADFDKPLKLVERNIEPASKILYLGCGTGLLLERLEDNYQVVGVDVSTEMVERARERCSSEIICSDVRELGLESEFDTVISFGQVINYLSERDLKEVLKSVKELLKPDGVLIFDSFSESYSGHQDARKHKIQHFTVQLNEKVKEKEGEWSELNLRYRVSDNSESSVELSDKQKVRLYGKEELRKMLLEIQYENIEIDNFYGSNKFLQVVANRS